MINFLSRILDANCTKKPSSKLEFMVFWESTNLGEPPQKMINYTYPLKSWGLKKHCYIHFSSFMKWFLFREPIRFFGVSIFFSKRQVCFRETVPPGPGSTPKSHKKSWSGSGQTKVQLQWIQLRAKEPRHSWGTKSDRSRPVKIIRFSQGKFWHVSLMFFLVPVPSSSSSEVTVGTTDQTSDCIGLTLS